MSRSVMNRTAYSRARRQAGAVASAAVFLLLATACTSGGGEEAQDKPAAEQTRSDADREVAYRACLRENGLDIPDPKPGEGMTALGPEDAAKMEKAAKACADKAPKGGAAGGELSQADKDKMLKYARCMRGEGVDMPDPEFKDGGAMAGMPMKESERAEFEKASKKCGSPV